MGDLGVVFMPRELTAENGAKSLLMGEFSERIEMPCPECTDLGEIDVECGDCEGSGKIWHFVPVSWTTITAIYAKAVEHFAT